ncbi:MAG: general secretion pathway protein GspB, partial [Marinobacter sp.]
VLAALFWPGVGLWRSTPATTPEMVQPVTAPTAGDARSLAPEVAVTEPEAAEAGPFADDQDNSGKGMEASQTDLPGIDADSEDVVVLETPGEAPTVIVPTVRPVNPEGESDDAYSPTPWEGRVPHLVELPMAFQRQVPDLVFNSHVYSERRSARSVMINNRYLRMGDSFGPLTVERITEQGVELSMDGQRFRVGVVRDWSSPR